MTSEAAAMTPDIANFNDTYDRTQSHSSCLVSGGLGRHDHPHCCFCFSHQLAKPAHTSRLLNYTADPLSYLGV